MLAQAIHSYLGSTEFLDVEGNSMWIVNEGEYRMMNTFDLTVEHLFFEMAFNPWTVANELDWFYAPFEKLGILSVLRNVPFPMNEAPGAIYRAFSSPSLKNAAKN